MKKTFYILLLFLLTLKGGILLFSMVKQAVWKNKVKSRTFVFEESNRKLFTFKENYFLSLKVDEKEFLYNGELYDILQIRNLGDSVKVIVFQDNVEKQIIGFIKNIFNDFSNDNNTIPSLIKKINSLVFILPEPIVLLGLQQLGENENNFQTHKAIIKNESARLLRPPSILA